MACRSVRVNATNQDYDFFRPWSKKNPHDFHGLGAVLPGNRVLVTAQLVANHSFVELERAERWTAHGCPKVSASITSRTSRCSSLRPIISSMVSIRSN